MALIGVSLGLGLCVVQAQAAERMAMGLIVKLKDSKPQPLARLQALAVPTDGQAKLQQRLSAAAVRTRLSFSQQRPTAFGAMVMHHRQATTLARAQTEAAQLRKDPDVEWVVVNELEQSMSFTTSDPYYSQQEWMRDLAAGGSPNIPAAFNRLEGRLLSPVIVAVLDTGVLPHPDLEGRVYRQGSANPGGYDFVSSVEFSNDGDAQDNDATDPGDYLTQSTIDQNPSLYVNHCSIDGHTAPKPHDSSWHGTEVAGILAPGNDGVGMVGILAPLNNVPVMPIRVAGACGAAVSDIIEGMFWAAGISYHGSPTANPHPAKVLSLSFGGAGGCGCQSKSNLKGEDSVQCLYQNAVDALTQKGALLVAAAGNGNEDVINPLGYALSARPAACPGVLAVTALRADGAKAKYANLTTSDTTHFSVATLGGDAGDGGIFTLDNAGVTDAEAYGSGTTLWRDYRVVDGTSFSTPIAAGTVALMWAANPGLSVADILRGLKTAGFRSHVATGLPACSATNLGNCTCTSSTCGPGVLDVYKAVDWALSATPTSSAVIGSGDFFVPVRGISNSSAKSSGGGGAMDGIGMLLLLLAAVLVMWRQRHHRPR